MHLHDKVEVGVSILFHLYVKEVGVRLCDFFSLFCSDVADVVAEFYGVAYPFICSDPPGCFFVIEVFVYFRIDLFVMVNDGGTFFCLR